MQPSTSARCQRQLKAMLWLAAMSAWAISCRKPSALLVAVCRSSKEPMSFALVKHSSAKARFHAVRAASPTVFHRCSMSASRAISRAMGRLLSARARSKRCSGSVATSRASSL